MTHADLDAALKSMTVTVDAAEAHGWLCGALCVRKGYSAKEWLKELATEADSAAGPMPDEMIGELPARTLEAFRSAEFDFVPLLPAENMPLRERVAALAAWCGGFLYGIGSGSSDRDIASAGEVGEFLRDLAEIARAELEPGRNVDASEGDFMELFEFVRAGAQLAFDELAGARAHASG